MKKFIGIISTAIIVLLLLFVVSVPIVNDYTATRIETKLKDIPLPEKSSYLESVSQAGKMAGNGNGMQFFGAILIESELSIDELNRFYSDYSNSEMNIVIEEQASQEIKFIEHGKLSFNHELSQSRNYFIIYAWSSGIEPFRSLDVRAH